MSDILNLDGIREWFMGALAKHDTALREQIASEIEQRIFETLTTQEQTSFGEGYIEGLAEASDIIKGGR